MKRGRAFAGPQPRDPRGPTRAVLHTRQVELNGFIHAMLTGTEQKSGGCICFGPRACEEWIAE